MNKNCGNCQYCREPVEMDVEMPGVGRKWCSNSQSTQFMTRVIDVDRCDKFQARGKKAPLMLRMKVKGMGLVNKVMRGRKK